jgi:hypothetical protein
MKKKIEKIYQTQQIVIKYDRISKQSISKMQKIMY